MVGLDLHAGERPAGKLGEEGKIWCGLLSGGVG